MTATAAYTVPFVSEEQDTYVLEYSRSPIVVDRRCLILSDDPVLISGIDAATSRRCFRVDDYADVQEAAIAALFCPPALAVLDLRLASANSASRHFAAFCRQLASEQATQVALIGHADDEQEEKLFRQMGATYYFPGVPSAEEIEQLAISAAARIRVSQRNATIELMRQAASNRRAHTCDSRYRPAA